MFYIENNNGRSMIEMLGVLAIIGVLSIGGIAGYSKAMSAYRMNKTIEQINFMALTIKNLFLSQRNYTGLVGNNGKINDKIAKIDKLFSWDIQGKNVYNGSYLFSEAHPDCDSNSQYCNPSASVSTAYIVGINNLPYDTCIALATYNWDFSGLELIGMMISWGGSDHLGAHSIRLRDCPKNSHSAVKFSDERYGICAADMPMSVSSATTVCSLAPANRKIHYRLNLDK